MTPTPAATASPAPASATSLLTDAKDFSVVLGGPFPFFIRSMEAARKRHVLAEAER